MLGSGSCCFRETSRGRPGTKYTLLRDISPYADNVYPSQDESALGPLGSGVPMRVGVSNVALYLNREEFWMLHYQPRIYDCGGTNYTCEDLVIAV
jgi:hypothetical protein